MSAPRILLTSLSGQLGGLELRLADEARQLQARGAEPMLAISPFPGLQPWLQVLRQSGLQTASFSPPPFFEEWRYRRLRKLWASAYHLHQLRKLAPDLVHVAYAWTHTGGSRLWLADRAGIPSVISVHNTFPVAPLPPWSARLMREAFRSVRGIYGVSHSALAAFQANYGEYIGPTTAQTVIHNFVDTQRFYFSAERRRQARALLDLPDDALVIGSIARLDKQKEPLTVLRCFEQVSRVVPNAHLVYVGSGGLEAEIKALAQSLGLTSRIRHLSFTPAPELIYPGLDVHLLLSRQEGFGISTVEAMASGVAVVCSDVPGSRDVLQTARTGRLVAYNDIEGTTRALIELLSDPAQRQALGDAGEQAARGHFDRSVWEQRIGSFYDGILPAGSGTPMRASVAPQR